MKWVKSNERKEKKERKKERAKVRVNNGQVNLLDQLKFIQKSQYNFPTKSMFIFCMQMTQVFERIDCINNVLIGIDIL